MHMLVLTLIDRQGTIDKQNTINAAKTLHHYVSLMSCKFEDSTNYSNARTYGAGKTPFSPMYVP